MPQGQDISPRPEPGCPFVLTRWHITPDTSSLMEGAHDADALFDLTAGSFASGQWTRFVHEDDTHPVTAIAAQLNQPPHRLRLRFRIKGQSGVWRWAEGGFQGTSSGDPHDFSGYLIDITQDIEDNERRERMKRFAFLEEMATALGHEINQPLNAIRLASENALHHIPDDTTDPLLVRLQQKLTRIAAQTLRASELVQSVRIFQKVARDERDFAIDSLIAQACTKVPDETGNIALKTTIASDLPHIQGDRDLLAQALGNIVRNAMERARAHVSLNAYRDADGNGIIISIKDDGPGFPDDMIQDSRAIIPFVTTKTSGHTIGLGLAISFCILRQHGGDLRLGRHEHGGGHHEDGGEDGGQVDIWLPATHASEPV